MRGTMAEQPGRTETEETPESTRAASAGRRHHIVFIPSVSGGIGHITRTLRLAREIQRLRPEVTIEYVLDQERMRPNNLDFVESTGYPARVLPGGRGREARNPLVRTTLGHADVIVDDATRYLIPYRWLIRAGWVSIPMYPLWDELFLDWPFLAQVDRVLWTYPAAMEFPDGLEPVRRKVRVTGPILGRQELPSREEARRTLGLGEDDLLITYSPRGMPFGRDFGEAVLAGLVNGFIRLRERYPSLRLVLTGVQDQMELRFPGMPDVRRVPGLEVHGVLPPEHIRALTAGANVVVAEGTTTTFEAITAGTPILMVPGSIYELWLMGMRFYADDAAVVLWIEQVNPDSMAEHLDRILRDPEASQKRVERARRFLGADGTTKAAQEILKVADARTK